MTKAKTKPSTGAYLLKMVEEMSSGHPTQPPRMVGTTAHLARVLYLHECLGGDVATFARVTGLHEEAIRRIVDCAQELD